ncbi:6267_t:CDS:2 [Diversispora eburnea]|uniref:6267_t:CDS:1 n=1 Tax=Diversispora eburnea TaxID=1213867 RepID=A0A9N9AQP6_9GLOM|nr:6267_t:CDS:2 [Diversispora eburnea]
MSFQFSKLLKNIFPEITREKEKRIDIPNILNLTATVFCLTEADSNEESLKIPRSGTIKKKLYIGLFNNNEQEEELEASSSLHNVASTIASSSSYNIKSTLEYNNVSNNNNNEPDELNENNILEFKSINAEYNNNLNIFNELPSKPFNMTDIFKGIQKFLRNQENIFKKITTIVISKSKDPVIEIFNWIQKCNSQMLLDKIN